MIREQEEQRSPREQGEQRKGLETVLSLQLGTTIVKNLPLIPIMYEDGNIFTP